MQNYLFKSCNFEYANFLFTYQCQVHPYSKPYYPRQNRHCLCQSQVIQCTMNRMSLSVLEGIRDVRCEHKHHHLISRTIHSLLNDDREHNASLKMTSFEEDIHYL